MTTTRYINECTEPLALCSTSTKTKFWLDDPKELYINNNYLIFVPKYEMTRNEQSNAISRLCFYAIIIILLFDRGETLLFIPVTILILIILANKLNVLDVIGKNKELARILNIRNEEKEVIKKEEEYENEPDVNIKYKTYQERIDDENKAKDYTLKTGYYDSNGDLVLGSAEYPPTSVPKKESNYTVDELRDYERKTCRIPTPDNPLMNLPTVDYGSPDQPVACNSNDDEINEQIKVNFNHELFRDIDEVWDKGNSQRQFYTMPNTAVPNMQSEFAEWSFKQPEGTVCKNVDMSNCVKFYDDLRYRVR
jgi:hypothetical protein